MFDKIAMNYITLRGWRVNDAGLLVLTEKQLKNVPYFGYSHRNPKLRSLMVPTLHGCTLLFEEKHFIVTK